MIATPGGFKGQRQDWQREERYHQLVELAPDGILVHDDVGQIVLANASAVRLAGATSRSELLGVPIHTFLSPPYLKAVQSELTDSVIPAGPAPPVRDTFRRLDGSGVEVEVRAVAFLDHGEPSAHLVIREVTERLAMERAAQELDPRLMKTQEMEIAGAFTENAAQELTTLLGLILGRGDLLRQDSRLPEACLADLREIMRAADRASTISRQLLTHDEGHT